MQSSGTNESCSWEIITVANFCGSDMLPGLETKMAYTDCLAVLFSNEVARRESKKFDLWPRRAAVKRDLRPRLRQERQRRV